MSHFTMLVAIDEAETTLEDEMNRYEDHKWDWYLVGGRWTGLLKLKDGPRPDTALNGEPGVPDPTPNTDPTRCDSALVKDIDWEGMRQERFEQVMKNYRLYQEVKQRCAGMTEGELREALHQAGFFILWDYDEAIYKLPENEAAEKARNENLTHGFIDPDGEWREEGEMGWFASMGNISVDFGAVWWKFVESLDQEIRVYVVDCHY